MSARSAFLKWKKICDHDMQECEKDYLRKDSFILRQGLNELSLSKKPEIATDTFTSKLGHILEKLLMDGHNPL